MLSNKRKRQWKNWSLPSKLTAIGTLVGVLSFGGYLIEKVYGLSTFVSEKYFAGEPIVSEVLVVAEIDNRQTTEITIASRGETFFWYPGSGAQHEIYAFDIVHSEITASENGSIVVPAQTKVKLTVKIVPTTRARHFLEQEHMGISLYFRGENFTKFSETFAFTKGNIRDFYLPVVLEEKPNTISNRKTKTGDVEESKTQNKRHYLKIVVSDASSVEIISGCIRLGGSFQTATDISDEICTSQKQIDGKYADSVKYVDLIGCAEAIIFSEASFGGIPESIKSCD